MLLKRLELQGFKSFADKTVLSFENGVTGVVGPNGSGKSNISDAIRWVMGEQSAKSLRGSNMQDVIFSGTEKRKAVNYAEVSLVLDNSEHVFNLDYEEITVTRRVFRSGETSYQINRSNCRLKDIHELFMDTGLGRGGYSIIGQGNVSQILSTKAEDRRDLFEEAAGISKYRYRKEEASRKLVNVEENLTRIQDITGELELQLEPLKRQSEKARQYMKIYDEFKQLDIAVSITNIENNMRISEETERLYNEANEELADIRRKESQTEEKIRVLYDKNRDADNRQTEKHNELTDKKSEIMEISNGISIAETNIKNSRAQTQREDEEVNELKRQIIAYSSEKERYGKELISKKEEIKSIENSFNDLRERADDAERERAEVYKKSEEKKADIIENMNSIAAKKAHIAGIEKLRNSFIERRNVIENELNSFLKNIEERKNEIEQNKAQKIAVINKRNDMQKRIADIEQTFSQAEQDKTKNTAQYNELRIEYNKLESRKRILEDMENSYEGYAKSVKTVLKSKELSKFFIYGTVGSLVEVDKQYVIAVETALGGALQNIIVESEDDAKAAINFLRERKAGRATFLPISSVKGRILDEKKTAATMDGYIGIAAEIVKYDKKYEGVIRNLLGRVVIVDTIDNGIKMAKAFGYKFRIVTLQGDVMNSGGSLSGGSVNKTAGVLSRASEIKELSKQIVTVTDKARLLKSNIKREDELIGSLKSQMDTFTVMLREYEDTLLKLDNNITHLSEMIQDRDVKEETYTNELNSIEENLNTSGDDIAVLINEVRKLENKIAAERGETAALDEKHAALQNVKDDLSNEIMEETMRLSALKKDIDLIQEHINSCAAAVANAEKAVEIKENNIIRLNSEINDFENEISLRKSMVEEAESAVKVITETINIINAEKQKIMKNLQDIQASGKDLTDRIILLQKEISSIETKKAKLDMERESISNRLWDEYELTLSSASDMKIDIDDKKQASKRLQELKASMRSLGHVNMESIQEYQNVKERYEFLSGQKADLEKSKDDLVKIVESMGELMEEHFEKQFKEINESFEKVFKELFGGGHGRLYLSDPNNILESGIEIEVQLPGKGLQNLNLYSGGEKSFIAIALLFAILNVKPTPFCILDEIDAALDDVNVSRFATYLKNYLLDSQFIVITHRRGTMEAANVLYGVTMQEKGVSKLLSLQIDDVNDDMAV